MFFVVLEGYVWLFLETFGKEHWKDHGVPLVREKGHTN